MTLHVLPFFSNCSLYDLNAGWRTVASVGDHCRSSTDLLWELKGRWSIFHEVPPSCGCHTWMFFLQSPLTSRPVDQHEKNKQKQDRKKATQYKPLTVKSWFPLFLRFSLVVTSCACSIIVDHLFIFLGVMSWAKMRMFYASFKCFKMFGRHITHMLKQSPKREEHAQLAHCSLALLTMDKETQCITYDKYLHIYITNFRCSQSNVISLHRF